MTATATASVPRLRPVDVDVLESLYQHRLLSTRQVHALHAPDATARHAQLILARLAAAGLADRTREPGGLGLWFVTERGAEAAESITSRAEMRRKLIRPEQAAGPLRHHTLAVNDVGIAFAKAARERGDEFGPFAWRHEIAHPLGPPPGRRQPEQLISDALLTYQLIKPGSFSTFYRLLELDRATMPVDALAAKLARYARLYHRTLAPDHPADLPVSLWTRLYPVFPVVLLVLAGDTSARLEWRRDAVLALCRDDAELSETPEVEISVCLLEDLIEQGPFAPIFHTHPQRGKKVNWLGGEG